LLVSEDIESHSLQTKLLESTSTVSNDVHKRISTQNSLFKLTMLHGGLTLMLKAFLQLLEDQMAFECRYCGAIGCHSFEKKLQVLPECPVSVCMMSA